MSRGPDGEPESTRRTRLALGMLAAAVPVVLVAVLAAAARDSATGGGGVDVAVPTTLWDVVVFALMTLALVLAVVIFVVQFGAAGREVRSARTPRQTLGAVVAAALCLAAFVALPERPEGEASRETPGAGPYGATGQELSSSGESTPTSTASALGGIALAGVIIVGTALWLRAGRGRGSAVMPVSAEDQQIQERDLLHGLLDDAIAELRADPDPRRAVITTWARLERALGAADLPRTPAETPFAYLGRILTRLDASGPAVERLTGLFERAMFSPHRIDAAAQNEAVDALVAVRDEVRPGTASR